MTENGEDQRPLLLTGGAGVIGEALIANADDLRFVCLTHRTSIPLSSSVAATVHGDITRTRFGLDIDEWRRLAASVRGVVHIAAQVDFGASRSSFHESNVSGTKNVLDFAAEAGMPLFHVSTAYVELDFGEREERTKIGAPQGTRDYVESKRRAEELVALSGVESVVLRPSFVVGDSATGTMARNQALQHVSRLLCRGVMPFLPFIPGTPVDFLPCDILGRAMAQATTRGSPTSPIWLTAGKHAPSVDELVDVCISFARRQGIEVQRPQFATQRQIDSLIESGGSPDMTNLTRLRLNKLIEMSEGHAGIDLMDSSLDDLGVSVDHALLLRSFERGLENQ